MGKLKDWFTPDPKAIVQNLYAAAILAILGVLSTFLSSSLSGFDPIGLTRTMNPAVAFVLYFVIFYIIGFVVTLFLRWLWKHIKQGKQVARPEDAPESISVEPERVQAKLEFAPFDDSPACRTVGIEIHSKESDRITNLDVELVHLFLVKLTGEREDKIDEISRDRRHFPSNNCKEPNTILGDDSVIVYLAAIDYTERLVFKLTTDQLSDSPKEIQGENGQIVKGTNHEIELCVHGQMDNLPIACYAVRASIHFEQSVKVLVQDSDTSPVQWRHTNPFVRIKLISVEHSVTTPSA